MEEELIKAQEDIVENVKYISKCVDVYKMVEQFILSHGNEVNGELCIDTEKISSSDCFMLVNELIYKVLEV